MAFLDAAMDRSVGRIVLLDAPAVLGWQTWREIDAVHGLGLVTEALDHVMEAGLVERQPVQPLAHLLLAALNEAAMLVANADDPPCHPGAVWGRPWSACWRGSDGSRRPSSRRSRPWPCAFTSAGAPLCSMEERAQAASGGVVQAELLPAHGVLVQQPDPEQQRVVGVDAAGTPASSSAGRGWAPNPGTTDNDTFDVGHTSRQTSSSANRRTSSASSTDRTPCWIPSAPRRVERPPAPTRDPRAPRRGGR